MDCETGIDKYTLLILCIKYLANENLLHSPGNSIPLLWPNLEGNPKRRDINIYIHIADSLCCTVETKKPTVLWSNYTSIKIKKKEISHMHVVYRIEAGEWKCSWNVFFLNNEFLVQVRNIWESPPLASHATAAITGRPHRAGKHPPWTRISINPGLCWTSCSLCFFCH